MSHYNSQSPVRLINSERAKVETHIPGYNDVHEGQLHQPDPSPLVGAIRDGGVARHLFDLGIGRSRLERKILRAKASLTIPAAE